ncbi:TetR family transcriptional regulator [Pseudoduganella sp. UC29_106]|uniref:TetR family transcriptional regulator n=1 Tax=Pseudoduganella sp. UC29_106 TaxID=3374553 RepID=UPI0037573949
MASAKLRRVMNRDRLEADIAAEAVRVFAECGYEGTSIATIAENAGLSKQNLMYYYPASRPCTAACWTMYWMTGWSA